MLGSGARLQVSIGRAPRAALAAALGALALLPPGVPDLLRPVLAIAIYCAGLLALGAVPSELLEQIPRPWQLRHS